MCESDGSDPQHNVDFYAGMLGLRLIKRTVNFDDPVISITATRPDARGPS